MRLRNLPGKCVLAAYIKRRSNLVMLAEKNDSVDVGELSLALKESLDYLSLTGADCSFDCGFSGKIDGKAAGVLYDFFEFCIAGSDDLPTAVLVRLRKSGGNIVILIESDAKADEEEIAGISARLKAKFSGCADRITVETDGEAVYASLTLACGGGV